MMTIPNISTLLVGAAELVAVWYILSAITAWYRLRHIPGPVLARFSWLWHAYYGIMGTGGPLYADLHNKYAGGGPFVRIAPNNLVTNDPDVLRRISSARTKYVRDDWYKSTRVHHEYGNVSTMLDNDEHDEMKAKTASGYNGRENGADFEPAVDSQLDALVGLIRRKYLSEGDDLRIADVSNLMRFFTLDTITRLAYSKSWGHLDEGTDVTGYIAHLQKTIKFISLCLDIPLFRGLFFSKIGLLCFGPRETEPRGVGRVMGVIHEIVSERFTTEGSKGKWNDMIGGFIRNGLTQQEVEGEANLQIIAGSETSAAVLAGTLMYLAATPHAYTRLKKAIHDAIESGLVMRDRPITFEQAQKIPYLQAVIWEGFRMRPPVNHGHYKVVPKGGDTIQGIYLPEGTAVGHNTLALTRNLAVFGKDAHIFRPERFMEPECDEEKKAYRFRSLDIVFGGGRWMCSGKTVAMYELNKALFELMRAFDFQVIDPKAAWTDLNYGLPCSNIMPLRISEADWSLLA